MRVPNRPGPSRRQFLQRAALLAAGTPAMMVFLDACAKSDQTSSSAPSMKIASPDKPVTWDIPKDNEAIADGLAPEKSATLQLYSYADYVSPDAIKSFQEKYGTEVETLKQKARAGERAPSAGRSGHAHPQRQSSAGG